MGAIARMGAGVVLLLAGIAMLFIPGPGILVMLFGLGLLGGESKTLARGMDRVEPALREKGRDAKRWWQLATWPQRAVVLAIVAMGALIAGYIALKLVL